MPTAGIERRRPGEREGARLPLAPELLEAIRQYETCTIADAIERCGVRLRNQGFTRPGLAGFTAGAPRAIGYAASNRVKSAAPPVRRPARITWSEAAISPRRKRRRGDKRGGTPGEKAQDGLRWMAGSTALPPF